MNNRILYLLFGFAVITPIKRLNAQDPITWIIKEGIEKVLRAVDLKVQRLQTKTIWLQNAQKKLENEMSQLKLDEISQWVERQRLLYRDYFEELQKVKSVLLYYHKVKEITDLQRSLVQEYRRSFDRIRKDAHFSTYEIGYMDRVYTAIIEESLTNLDGLSLVINSFTTQMTDEKRVEVIEGVKEALQKNFDDLRAFSLQNFRLSLSRAKDESEILQIRNWYGLQ